MTVDPQTAKERADYRGQTYYFCCAGCRTKFIAEPQKYLGGAAPEPVSKARSTPARCIRRSGKRGPGSCPICGMALEPEIATADTGPNPELADMTRRFWIGLVLGAAGDGAGNGRPCCRRASADPPTLSN